MVVDAGQGWDTEHSTHPLGGQRGALSWYLPPVPRPAGPDSMRLAYFSPLPPQRSGIADYSAELLPVLAGHLEVEPFVDEGVKVDPGLASRFTIRGDGAFQALWEAGRYDAVL